MINTACQTVKFYRMFNLIYDKIFLNITTPDISSDISKTALGFKCHNRNKKELVKIKMTPTKEKSPRSVS